MSLLWALSLSLSLSPTTLFLSGLTSLSRSSLFNPAHSPLSDSPLIVSFYSQAMAMVWWVCCVGFGVFYLVFMVGGGFWWRWWVPIWGWFVVGVVSSNVVVGSLCFLDLGFVAMGLARFCGQRWFLVVVVCSDMGWICSGDGGGFAIGFLDLGFARGFG